MVYHLKTTRHAYIYIYLFILYIFFLNICNVLSDILFLTFFLAYIPTFYRTCYVDSILTYFPTFFPALCLASILTYFLEYFLAFFLALSDIRSGILSDIYSKTCWPFYLACWLAFSLVWVRVQVRSAVPVPASSAASMDEWREEGSRGIEKGIVTEKGVASLYKLRARSQNANYAFACQLPALSRNIPYVYCQPSDSTLSSPLKQDVENILSV